MSENKPTPNEIAREFLKNYKKNIVQACIVFSRKFGPGLLVVNLEKPPEKEDEIDIEFWDYSRLPPDIKSKMTELKKTIYYCLTFPETTLFFQESLS